MERFTYPAEQFDEKNLDKNIILTLVKKHEGMVGRLLKNKRYYDGHHEIEKRKRDKEAPNSKRGAGH